MKGLYPIINYHPGFDDPLVPIRCAHAVRDRGLQYLQIRLKNVSDVEFLRIGHQIVDLFQDKDRTLIINDRADIAICTGAKGLHLGQEDIAPRLIKSWFPGIVGLSCHSHKDLEEVLSMPVQSQPDYLGFGPIFETSSKQNPDPVVGLEGLKHAVDFRNQYLARTAKSLPIVAIGGIQLHHLQELKQTGVDAFAVISAIDKFKPERSIDSLMNAWEKAQ